MTEGNSLLCPSSPGTEGTLLIGVVQPDKTVNLIETPLEVDYIFLELSKNLGPLEKRFRFANKCIKSGCKQWTGQECGVMKVLSGINKQVELNENLKPCTIRERCRWFAQDGARACTICTYVVTNNLEENESFDVPRTDPGTE